MPVLSLRLWLAQVGAPTAVLGRCGHDWDMVPIAGHPLHDSFMGGKFDAPVSKLGTSLLYCLLPPQLVEVIPCTGTLLLCLVPAVVHPLALEHSGPQAISHGLAK